MSIVAWSPLLSLLSAPSLTFEQRLRLARYSTTLYQLGLNSLVAGHVTPIVDCPR